MKVALLQTDITWNEPSKNVVRDRNLAEEAVAGGANLLVFPEMFTCGFSLLTGAGAEEANAAGTELLRELSKANSIFCAGSLPEVAKDGQVYNTLYVFGPTGLLGSYRKIHLFSFGDENQRYSSGQTVSNIVVGELRVSLFICYDLRFPQTFASMAESTDLFIVVANWPAARRRHWLTLLQARAIENQAFVAGVNRVGEGGGLSYAGDSRLFGPDGSELAALDSRESFVISEVQGSEVGDARATFPTLRDRQHETYRMLSEQSSFPPGLTGMSKGVR